MKKNYLNKISPKKIFSGKIFLPLACAAFLASCGCPEFNTQATIDPRVREATITEFNAGWDFVEDKPVPEYSIHNFLFPSSQSSSGSLPNDNRVASNKTINIFSKNYTLNDTLIKAIVYVNKPSNTLLVGDILVDTVFIDPLDYRNSRARLRFYGYLGKFTAGNLPLTSSSAGAFADYLRSQPVKNEIQQLGGNLSQFGKALGNSISGASAFRARLTDAQGKIIDDKNLPAANLRPLPPPDVISSLDSAAQNAAISETYGVTVVEVKIGEVYYYRAKNGIDFGVFIENISQGNLDPKLRRVTIKFAELKGPSCQP